MPVPCEWIPVRRPAGRRAAFRCAEEADIFRDGVRAVRRRARAAARPLARPVPVRLGFAQRAATYAKGGGKTVAFALAAFRQAYAGGRSLGRRRT